MSKMRRLLVATTIGLGLLPLAIADNGFVVRNIQVQGLERIREGTVLSYLPVHVGQTFTSQDSANVLNALYQTGFFSNVQLMQKDDTLVIRVSEQPVVGLITVEGNKAITNKQLNAALKKMGVVEGEAYNPAKLKAITQGVQQEYAILGHPDATVATAVTNEPRNRVAIDIRINEGDIAKIRHITIVGNHAFSQRRLLRNFQLTSSGPLTIITHTNRYSADKLDQDLQALQYFYFNYGYLHFKVVSRDVVVNPINHDVNIVIGIEEGPIYHVSGYRIDGPFAQDPEVIKISSEIRPGEIFSREKMINATHELGIYFANKGYAFPQINVNPILNDVDRTVVLAYEVFPGEQVYVRHINFTGNAQTQDFVLRSQTIQMEDSLFSLKDIQESKRRLANLPYLQGVEISPTPVPGHPDLVDLDYSMTEINAGKASVEGGYSDQYGFLAGVNISDPNFLGTGKYVSLGYTRSQLYSQYSFSYTNPFFTNDGISQSVGLFYNRTTANSSLGLASYTYDDFGGTLSYGIPISEYDAYSAGLGYDNISISNITQITPPPLFTPQGVPVYNGQTVASAPSVLHFLQQYGSNFYDVKLLAGFAHSTLDQAMFPNRGNTQALNITVGPPVSSNTAHGAVGFYQATYSGQWYFPLGYGFIIEPHTALGYGNSISPTKNYPFFSNFYAGGIDSLPGFDPNSLGPKNPNNGNNAIGGNVEILGGLHFIFPNPYPNKLRTALLLDAGNIFDSNEVQYTLAEHLISPPVPFLAQPGLQNITYESIALKNIRVATGLVVEWYSPMGPIDFSLATPIVKKQGDQVGIFGFTFGMAI